MFDYVTFLALQDQKFKWAFGKPANKRPGILKKMWYMEATDGAEVLLRIMKDNNLTQYDLKWSSTTVEPNTPDTPELEEIKHGDPEKITITWETIVFDHERSDEWELLTRDIKQVIWKPKTFNASNTDLWETEFLDSASTVDTQMKLFKYVKFGIEKNAWFITYVLKDKDWKKVFTFGSADDFSGSASGTRFHYNEGTRRWVSPTVSEWTVTLNWKEYTFKYKFWVALTKAQFFLLVDE
jgi:hypothetical protein